jgi:hypothetical protein
VIAGRRWRAAKGEFRRSRGVPATVSDTKDLHVGRTQRDKSRRGFVEKLGMNLTTLGLGLAPGLYEVGKTVKRDLEEADPLHGDEPFSLRFKRSRKLGKEMAESTYEDLRHPLRNPGYTLATALGAVSLGAGAAARGAAGVNAARTVGARAALTRAGHQGGSLLRRPEPGTVKLRKGDLEVERPLSRNALVRRGQKIRAGVQQRRLDRDPDAQVPGKGLGAFGQHRGAEASVGREVRARRRVEKAEAAAPLLAQQRARRTPVFGRSKVTDGELAALRVAAIEGFRAFREPDEVIDRHVATHRRWIDEGEDATLHGQRIDELEAARAALKENRSQLRALYRETRRLSMRGEKALTKRDLLTDETARDRVARMAQVYGRDEGGPPAGAFFYPAAERFKEPRTDARAYDPRPRETGLSPAQPGRVPGLRKRFTGKGERAGRGPSDVADIVAEGYARRTHLISARDFYDELRTGATERRVSNTQIPIRDTSKISVELRRAVAQLEEATPEDADAIGAHLRKELDRLADELEAPEHQRAAVGTKVKGVVWVDRRLIQEMGEANVRGPIEKLADFVNNPIRLTTLYARPAYALNLLGNAGMILWTQGTKAPITLEQALRAPRKLSAEDVAMIDSLAGTGRARSYAVETGTLSKTAMRAAEGWNTVTDLVPRRMAVFYEMRQAGFTTPEEVKTFLHDPGLRRKRVEVARRARKNMVDFDSLTPLERNHLRHYFYFYAWISRGTAWAVRAAVEHPAKTLVAGQIAEMGQERQNELLGAVPSWFRGRMALGAAKAGRIATVDPRSVVTFTTAADTLGAIPNVARAIIGLPEKPGPNLRDLLTPAAEAFATGAAGGRDPGGLRGVIESHPFYAAGERAGLYGEPPKTYPDTGRREALGPLAAGGLSPRSTDTAELAEQAIREMRARFTPAEKAAAGVQDRRDRFLEEIKRVAPEKLDKGRLPAVLRQAFEIEEERQWLIAEAREGREPKTREYHFWRLVAEVALLVKFKQLTAEEGGEWLERAEEPSITVEQIKDTNASIVRDYWSSERRQGQLWRINEAKRALEERGATGLD